MSPLFLFEFVGVAPKVVGIREPLYDASRAIARWSELATAFPLPSNASNTTPLALSPIYNHEKSPIAVAGVITIN
jgi:hypothetical protein